MEISHAILKLFGAIDTNGHRFQSRKVALMGETIGSASKIALALLIEQDEALKDAYTGLQKEVYPNRFTDLSTPQSKKELLKLETEIKNLKTALELLNALSFYSSELKTKAKEQEINQALARQDYSFGGM